MTRTAFLVVDMQVDFCEGGALAVAGSAANAQRISDYLRAHRDEVALVAASRDFHHPRPDTNGGHFAADGAPPDFVQTWPDHCVAGTPGAEYHPGLDLSLVDVHVLKGQGKPAYSMFEGVTGDGRALVDVLRGAGVDELVVAGTAYDYCVLATVLDGRRLGFGVTLLEDLSAGVAPDSTAAARAQMLAAGARLVAGEPEAMAA